MNAMLFLEDTFDEPASKFYPDRKVRAMTEQLLDLRRRAEGGEAVSLREKYEAARLFSSLAVALLSWVVRRLGLRVSCSDYARMAAADKRRLLSKTVRLGLPILQPKGRYELPDGMEAANFGQATPLLEPKKIDRRGRAPQIVGYAQLGLLRYRHLQIGLGRNADMVEDELADKACLSKPAIAKWRGELTNVYPQDWIARELYLAEQVGRYEQSGRDWNQIDRTTSDENEELYRAAVSLERDLDLLCALRKEGAVPRLKPKSRVR